MKTQERPETIENAGTEEGNVRYFRDILLRLSFAAHGWDPRLDGVLERLQDELRTHTALPDLKEYSETLYRALMRAEEQRPAREPGQIVARAFADLKLPESLQEQWRELLEEARHARDEVQALEVLERCAVILEQALKESTPASGRKSGFISSLFGGGGKDKSDPERFLKAVQHRLLELLGSLCPPPELEDQIKELKESIARHLEEEDIPQVLERINLLIQDMRGRLERERLELEKFLGQLTERLTHIGGALEASDDSTRKVFENRQKLDQEIESQTRDMESRALNATDLSALKALVQERVDSIRQRMEEHRSEEQKLIAEQEQQMKELKERLKEMEEETEQLRTQVREERHQAFTDALTGLPNRFAYEERLEQEYERWKRYQSPLSLIVIDVDHFKRINDTYGHQAGDKALRIIARELSVSTRKTDFIGRYGGEEIVILMPETSADAALAAAEKLRKKIEECGFHFREKKVTITVSCGISEYRQGDTPESAFERADQALYEAKRSGRNRCVVN